MVLRVAVHLTSWYVFHTLGPLGERQLRACMLVAHHMVEGSTVVAFQR
jgi:hypothetical protein